MSYSITDQYRSAADEKQCVRFVSWKNGKMIFLMASFRAFVGVFLMTNCVHTSVTNDIVTTIPREFILVTPKLEDVNVGLEPLLDALNRRHISLVNTIVIGSRGFVIVRTQERKLDFLSGSKLVDIIEANQRVSLIKPTSASTFILDENTGGNINTKTKRSINDDVEAVVKTAEACTEQDIGSNGGWGLVRTSYHDTPDYTSQPYRYENQGAGVDIYILDTGVDVAHSEFQGRAYYGMVANGLNTSEKDMNGHGTNVAGIAAGQTYGMAKNATIISCKILGDDGMGTIADVLEGIAWVTDQVHGQTTSGKTARAVINMSLDSRGISQSERTAIETAVGMGITVVAAAGNNAGDACEYSPAGFMGSVITVAASSNDDSLASFSNWGRCVDIVAPGVNIRGPWSEESSFCSYLKPIRRSRCFATVNGTSQSTPFVTGTVAKYLGSLSHDRMASVTPSSVASMIISTATNGSLHMEPPLVSTDTPNKLVFCDCEEEAFWALEPDIPSSADNGMFKIPDNLMLMLVTFIVGKVLANVICIH